MGFRLAAASLLFFSLCSCTNNTSAANAASSADPATTTEPSGQPLPHSVPGGQGGRVLYGVVPGQTTEAGAMGEVLRSLHKEYGVRPQVGRPFQFRGTHLTAVFFSLPGKTPQSGMLLASKTTASQAEAGLLYDDSQRFARNMNPMLQSLFSKWHPAGTGSASATPAAEEPLQRFTLQDNSASVSLPASWHVLPGSGGGTILAEGPHRERIGLGLGFYAMDSRNPAAQSAMRYAQGAGRNTAYAQTMYYPYGGDLGRTFADLTNMFRRQHGFPPDEFQISRQTPIPAQGQRCAELQGKVKVPEDGNGYSEMNTVFCSAPPVYGGGFLSAASYTAVPLAYADQERPLMGAILSSFQPNMAVIQGQANAIAAPTVNAIHEIGKRADIWAKHSDDMRIATRENYEHTQDVQDRAMQGYTNAFRENSVVLDKWSNAHGTLDNGAAEFLVQSDPNRFEYVDTPNYWRGIDY